MKFRIAIINGANNAILATATKEIDSTDCPLESLKQQIEFLPAAVIHMPAPEPTAKPR